MLQFVDSFYCAYNQPKGNYVIKFRQEEPIENGPDADPGVQTNEIASVNMDKDCAVELARAILQFHEESENDSDILDENADKE